MLGNRIQQTSTTTGTGTYSLTGTVANRNTFIGTPPNGFATGSQVYYLAEENGVGWEIGIGTVTDLATDTLSRDTILGSSNGGLAVNWGVGTRQIACLPASELLGPMGGRLLKGAVGGTANAITITTPIPLRALTDGASVLFDATANNTGAVTVNVDGTGAVALKDATGAALTQGAIRNGQSLCIAYKSSTGFWHVLSPLAPAQPPASIISGTTHAPALADNGATFIYTNAGGCTVTLPAASGLVAGYNIALVNSSGGAVTVNRSSTDTIWSKNTSLTSMLLPSAGDSGRLYLDSTGGSAKYYWVGRRSFDSGDQTITAAGGLTIAHSLGVSPDQVFTYLHNTTNELNYTGETVLHWSGVADQVAIGNRGCAVWPDATNLNVRFGSAAATFAVANKTTGVSAAITNANWRFVLRAIVEN